MKLPLFVIAALCIGSTTVSADCKSEVDAIMNAMMSNFKDERSNMVCGSAEDFGGHSYPVYKYDSAGDVMGVKTLSHLTIHKGENGLPVGFIVDGTAWMFTRSPHNISPMILRLPSKLGSRKLLRGLPRFASSGGVRIERA